MRFSTTSKNAAIAIAALSLLAGSGYSGDAYKHAAVDNVFNYPSVLPLDLRRVVVLPISCDSSQKELADAAELFNPVLHETLINTRRFETVSADTVSLRAVTGRLTWSGAEMLPEHFFESLNNEYGSDAVLFSQLTIFHGYTPMAVGWRLKLVDTHTGKILWATDEIFDTTDRTVAAALAGFQKHQARPKAAGFFENLEARLDGQLPASNAGAWQSVNSPRLLASFTLKQLLNTLPER